MKQLFPKLHLFHSARVEPLIAQFSRNELDVCLAALSKGGSTALIVVNGTKMRVTRLIESPFTAFALSADPDRVKSRSLMRNELSAVIAAAPTIFNAAERSEKRARRLIHNLKSVTAKTMQDVFAVAQQHELIGKTPADQLQYIRAEISKHPTEAASAFVEILKHQAAQKAEYAAFETLSGAGGSQKRERHEVHKVLMNVFYLFFGDFIEHRAFAQVAHTRETAFFDYDSVHACIYYIVDNSVKYIQKGSRLDVSTETDGPYVVIRFSMTSTYIGADEEDLIFQEAYSGKLACEQKKNGTGIGLYLARQLAQLNGGDLTLLCRRKPGDQLFSANTFVLALPARI